MLARESQLSVPQQDQTVASEQERLLSIDQKIELDAYLDRSRAEYLQRILEQVNQQNVEYFENLCCEYTLQKMRLEKRQYAPDRHLHLMADPNCMLCRGLPSPDDKICECIQRKLAEEETPSAEVGRNLPFMNKLSIINMHLEILYKSIVFLDSSKINAKLTDYKKVKQIKQR